jgi:hypothetical protein
LRAIAARPAAQRSAWVRKGYAFEVENGLRDPTASRPGIGLFSISAGTARGSRGGSASEVAAG